MRPEEEDGDVPRRYRDGMVVPPTARAQLARWGPAALAAALALFTLAEALGGRGRGSAPTWAQVALAVLVAVCCSLRVRHPVLALAVLAAATVAAALPWGLPPEAGLFLAVLLTVYSVARHGGRAAQPAVAVALVPFVALMEWRDPTTTSVTEALPTFALVAAAWGVGWAVRRSAERSRELADLAEQLRAERAETARLAVLTERLHIARELHDILAHSLSVMVVQVGAARLALGQVPAPAEKALRSAEAVGRESLGELRRLLGILRDDSEQPHEPQPGLAQLPALVAAADAEGQRIRLTVADDLPELPPALDLTAFRLLQESVTNIVRHAPGAPARIGVRCEDGELLIDVWNGPPVRPGSRNSSPGHGLRGMRERVAVYGGQVSAGAAPDGSFTVHARLPMPVPAAAAEGSGRP